MESTAPPVQLTLEEKRFLMESAVLMRDTKRLDQAMAMFKAIVPLVEDKHLPTIGIGSIHFERGEFDEAVEAFENATELNPESALAYAHLGEALAFAKHMEEAKLALKKAQELDPSGNDGGTMARSIEKFLALGLL